MPSVFVACKGRCGTLNIAQTLQDMGEHIIHSQIPLIITREDGYAYQFITRNPGMRRFFLNDYYLNLSPSDKIISIHGSDADAIMAQRPAQIISKILSGDIRFFVLTRHPITQINSGVHKRKSEVSKYGSRHKNTAKLVKLCQPGGGLDHLGRLNNGAYLGFVNEVKKLYTFSPGQGLTATSRVIEILTFLDYALGIFYFNSAFGVFTRFLAQKNHVVRVFYYEDVFESYNAYADFITQVGTQKRRPTQETSNFDKVLNAPSGSSDAVDVFQNWGEQEQRIFTTLYGIFQGALPERQNQAIKQVISP